MSEVPRGYKQTEVGVIPEDWEACLLGKVATLQRGHDLPHRRREPGDVPIVTSSGVGETHSEAKVTGPGVVTGRYGTIGEVFYIVEDFWPLNTTLYVRNFHGNDPLYIAYLLRTIDFHSHSGKSGVPGVNRNDLHEIIIPIPPTKAEQEAIAEALSDTDALIESLEQLIVKKRRIKQGAIQELLTGKKRLPGFSGDWKVKRLVEVFNISAGGDFDPSCSAQTQDENHPFPIYSNAITDSGLYGYCTYSDHSENTITVTARGTLGCANYRNHRFTAIGRVLILTPMEPVDGRFLAEFINARIDFVVESTGVPQLTAPQISKYSIPVPPLPEQTAIATILSDMDAEIAALEEKLKKARHIKQGMMQELLTGRIRLVNPVLAKEKCHSTHPAPKSDKPHNWAFNEAVVISVLTDQFGKPEFPLGRKRYTKLSYLMHRKAEQVADGYLKKAAGPYNHKTKYAGPEKIALENSYIREHQNGKFKGFVAADKIDQAKVYFTKRYGKEISAWLEQFRYKSNDELECLATVDMAIQDLEKQGRAVDVCSVRTLIASEPLWLPKLERAAFADDSIEHAIYICRELFS